MLKLKDVENFNQLSVLFEVRPKKLYQILSKKNYTTFEIPKKNGSIRKINKPNTELLMLQKKLKVELEKIFNSHKAAHGFIKDKSIITNATAHLKNDYILNIDLKDFFHSIQFPRIRGMFINYFKFDPNIATILANICCHPDGYLPQGSPTSPIISNVILKILDRDLYKYCARRSLIYTRYADDITISSRLLSDSFKNLYTMNREKEIILRRVLETKITGNYFKINNDKIRVYGPNKRQEVTGIVINKKINVNRRYIKLIRAILNSLEKDKDLAEETYKEKYKDKNIYNSLKGKIEYIGYVRSHNKKFKDDVFINLAEKFNGLSNEVKVKRFKPPIFVIPEQNFKLQFNLYGEIYEDSGIINDEMEFEKSRISQGTCFIVKGKWLITNYHVVSSLIEKLIEYEKNGAFLNKLISLYITDENGRDYNLSLLPRQYSKENDWISFEVMGDILNEFYNFDLGDSSNIKSKDKYNIYGYPDYRHGNSLTTLNATVNNKNFKHMREDDPLIAVSETIYGGTSGGPMLDNQNRVIGIAVRGQGSHVNQVIPINYLNEKSFKEFDIKLSRDYML